ncbi:MAG: aminotransferase class IV family protein [Cypionkella sp.]
MESTLSDGAFDPDLRLIETLLWDGEDFPRLALHLERLERSALALGWPAPQEVTAALFGALAGLPAEALRVRLTMDRLGAMRVERTDLPPPKDEWRLGVSEVRLDSADPWLRLKTTRRAVYDAAQAARNELDEMIFCNERGEVCEGTITNLFFDRGQGMRTPPLACGLLPGVLRAELGVKEEVLRVEDLGRVQLWVGNALRGLISAKM